MITDIKLKPQAAIQYQNMLSSSNEQIYIAYGRQLATFYEIHSFVQIKQFNDEEFTIAQDYQHNNQLELLRVGILFFNEQGQKPADPTQQISTKMNNEYWVPNPIQFATDAKQIGQNNIFVYVDGQRKDVKLGSSVWGYEKLILAAMYEAQKELFE
ncbi:Hypothetical_protein [Hexamita inflata]|uniref:Hypothetical_protein n=1 Tax=Hexamita inflata TaxID=28002 RepID=A0AA86P4E4_9EUKA|nr:Hypothetical protein HINF_LOCUS19236 [Hexamita inflata]